MGVLRAIGFLEHSVLATLPPRDSAHQIIAQDPQKSSQSLQSVMLSFE